VTEKPSSAKPPAGGQRSERWRKRHDTIIDIARSSFFEKGYAGTSMSTIAAQLGGSKTTLWSHFPCKDELFTAVLEDLITRFGPRDRLDPTGDMRAELTRYCAGFLNILLSPQILALHRLIIAEAPRFPELGRIFYERAPRRRYLHLGDYFQLKMNERVLRPADSFVAARHLLHLCQSGVFFLRLWEMVPDPSPEEVMADVETGVEAFLNGYCHERA